MKRFLSFMVMFMCILAMATAVAFGADPAPAVAPVIGFFDWFKMNSVLVFGALLALSELLSMIPAFHGNGILDTIIKALKLMTAKQTQATQAE